MLANLHNAKKAFLVNLSDDGKVRILGQIPTQAAGLVGDLSDKSSLESFENLSRDKHMFKRVRSFSRSKKTNSLQNLSPSVCGYNAAGKWVNLSGDSCSRSGPSLQNMSPKSLKSVCLNKGGKWMKADGSSCSGPSLQNMSNSPKSVCKKNKRGQWMKADGSSCSPSRKSLQNLSQCLKKNGKWVKSDGSSCTPSKKSNSVCK
jgi:hypothetical protein